MPSFQPGSIFVEISFEADFPKILKNKGIDEIREKSPYLSRFLKFLTFTYFDSALYADFQSDFSEVF